MLAPMVYYAVLRDLKATTMGAGFLMKKGERDMTKQEEVIKALQAEAAKLKEEDNGIARVEVYAPEDDDGKDMDWLIYIDSEGYRALPVSEEDDFRSLTKTRMEAVLERFGLTLTTRGDGDGEYGPQWLFEVQL